MSVQKGVLPEATPKSAFFSSCRMHQLTSESMTVPAVRAMIGYLAATALASALMTVPYVIHEDADTTQAGIFVFHTRVIDDIRFASLVFITGWLVSTVFAYLPFLFLFWLGRFLTLWGLPYALVTGVISAEFAAWSAIFALVRGRIGLLNEMTIAAQLTGLAMGAGLAGGLLFWWLAVRKDAGC